MLTLPPDPYLALKVERDAGLPEIRTAYRKLILKCHPDKIQDPLQKQLKQDEFQKVQSAYELLSSDVEKSRYDNMYKLHQLEKESRARMDTSVPATGRSSRRERDSEYPNVRVHMAEPRPNSYSNSPFSSPSKGYAAGTPPSRSYEEVYTTYEPAHPPRKTASYESARGYKTDWEKRSPRDERDDKYERKSKKEDKKDHEKSKVEKEEKRKEREKDLRREEKKREKERAERKEKERAERKEKEKKEKKAEQLRKKDADVKAAQAKVYPSQKYPAAAYSSSSEDDEPKPTRRASGTREEAPPATSERERKYSETIEVAADYLARSGAKVSINSSRPKPQATEHFARHIQAIPTAPTPPVVGSPFAPPPPQADIYEEDEPHRASKSSGRRAEKSYKKSGARASSRDPASVEYTHRPPPLQHSATMPIRSRQTETAYNIGRPMPPSLNRAQTFQESSSRYPRERSRSRTRRYHSDDEDSDGDRHARHSRSHRSPERTAPTKIRYAVGSDKTSTRQISSEDMSRHHKSSKSGYPAANTGARMDPEYNHYSAATPGKVRYAPTFGAEEVKYASYNVREEPVYGY